MGVDVLVVPVIPVVIMVGTDGFLKVGCKGEVESDGEENRVEVRG